MADGTRLNILKIFVPNRPGIEQENLKELVYGLKLTGIISSTKNT